MAVAEFLEDIVSHLPALHLLQHLGFQYLTPTEALALRGGKRGRVDRKSTRLNSSHLVISYAVFCLKKKTESSDIQTAFRDSTSVGTYRHYPVPTSEDNAVHPAPHYRY